LKNKIKMEISKKNSNNLKPMWITGFSDGESSFSVAISRNKAYKTGIYFIPAYAIELKDKDLDLLYKIQAFFKGVGRIHRIKGKGHAVYVVSSIPDLMEVIIPHFTKYPLLTVKRITFLLFKDIVELMYKKNHLTLEGAQSIINIIASMNKGRTDKFLRNFPNINIVPVVLPKVNLLSISHISTDWFVGFTDAEGCFFINVRPNRKNTGHWALAGFSLVQHNRDFLLFKLLKRFLGGGFIIEEDNKNVVRFRAERLSFMLEVIIPLFNKNPLQSSKVKDYQDFCLACQLIKSKSHHTKEGIAKIKDLKNNMNTKRIH
jgi:hypothetical protein